MKGKVVTLERKKKSKKVKEPVCPDCYSKMNKGYYIEEDNFGRLLKVYAWYCDCS